MLTLHKNRRCMGFCVLPPATHKLRLQRLLNIQLFKWETLCNAATNRRLTNLHQCLFKQTTVLCSLTPGITAMDSILSVSFVKGQSSTELNLGGSDTVSNNNWLRICLLHCKFHWKTIVACLSCHTSPSLLSAPTPCTVSFLLAPVTMGWMEVCLVQFNFAALTPLVLICCDTAHLFLYFFVFCFT